MVTLSFLSAALICELRRVTGLLALYHTGLDRWRPLWVRSGRVQCSSSCPLYIR